MKSAMRHTMRWAAILLTLSLGACASIPDNGPLLGAALGKDVQQLLVTEQPGTRLRVKGVGEVAIGRSYVAASGRTCRRLTRLDGTLLPLRRCQNKSGQWYTTRSISVSLPLSDQAQSVESGFTLETVALKVKQGESLWTFASRVTGDPLNWKRIVTVNGIQDADHVRSDQTLMVEVSMLRDAR